MGDNGAGKSTMLKILSGVIDADEGELFIDGEPVALDGPRAAEAAGIAVIHQELNLAEDVSVAENVFVGHEPRTRWRTIDFRQMRRRTAELLAELHAESIDPAARVSSLSLARKQLVEIARALQLDARVLIMDEPTSSLAGEEVEVLLELMRRLRADGVAIVYVSHRLDEIMAVADRITVLRDGALVGVRERAECTDQELVAMMVGRELEAFDPEPRPPRGECRLRVTGLRRGASALGSPLHDVSLDVHAGEIVGVAGLVGAGRTEVARAILGVDPVDGGEIHVEGDPLKLGSPAHALRAGIGLVPEDRKSQGLFLDQSVRANIAAASTQELSPGGLVRRGRERELADEGVQRLGIRTASIEGPVSGLSGGNQQKVVLAKWLARAPSVLILDEPTRGVDVGATAEIYRLVHGLAADGIAILVISSELSEVLQLADRVIVMREGAVTGELSHDEATEARIMALATGTHEEHTT